MIRRFTGSWFLVVVLACVVGLVTNGLAQSVSFGSNTLGNSSTKTATLTFPATGGPFTVNSINVVTGGASGSNLDFAAATGGTCTTTAYTTGQTCTVSVTFTPKSPGLRMGAVVLRDSSSNALATTFIYGVGEGPQLALLPGVITTVAGNGSPDSGPANDNTAPFGDGGPATSAKLDQPYSVSVDGAGNLYINEGETYSVIRKVDAASQMISTVVGDLGGDTGYYGDTGKSQGVVVPNNVVKNGTPENDGVILNGPIWVAVDGADNLYINDYNNNVIRKIDAVSHIITTVVGSYPAPTNCPYTTTGTPPVVVCSTGFNPGGYGGDGGPATQPDGTALTASSPEIGAATSTKSGAVGLAFDGAGNMYIADKGNNVIRKVDAVTQFISTFAGVNYDSSTTCKWDGDSPTALSALSAHLCDPADIAVDASGNLYIAEAGNNVIRKVDTNQAIATVVGIGPPNNLGYSPDGTLAASAKLNAPLGIAVDAAGDLYFSENCSIVNLVSVCNNIIRKVDPVTQALTTVAGVYSNTGGYSGDNGPATSALLNSPAGIALDSSGNLYIADTNNHRIRKVSVTTAPLAFPSTVVGAKSADQTVTASNVGNTPASLSTATTTVDFVFDSSNSTCATSLGVGASCAAEVYFAPKVSGPLSDTLAFNAATLPIPLSGTATAEAQTITSFPNPGTQTYGVAPFALTASASSGLAVTYTVVSGPATVLGSTLTITGVGSVKVQAAQAGNASWSPATPVSVTFAVNKATLTVTGITANNKVYDGTNTATLNLGSAALVGVASGDTGKVSLGTTYTATFADASIGDGKAVTVSGLGLSGTAAGNYTLTQPSGLTANITPVPTAPVPTAPRVVTLPMINVNATTVRVDGIVNPNQAATTYWFEYGTRPALVNATRTTSQTLPASGAEVAVSANLTGLTPHAVYYFRVVAQNSVGISRGQILDFRSGGAGVRPAVSNILASPINSALSPATASPVTSVKSSSGNSPAATVKTATTVSSQTTTLQVVPGQMMPLVVSLSGVAAGTPITGTCAELPAGATCSYDANNQTVTITPAADTPPGSYPVQVTFSTTSGAN